MKSLTPYSSPPIYGVGLLSPSPRPEVETQFFSAQRWAASVMSHRTILLSMRPLSHTAKQVELRVFNLFLCNNGRRARGLNIQITLQIRSGSARIREEGQGPGKEFSCALKPYMHGNLHRLGNSKAGEKQNRIELPASPPAHLPHFPTPGSGQITCCKLQAASAARISCPLPYQGFFLFDSFNRRGNEVSTL